MAVKDLLAFIGRIEAPKGYGQVWGGIRSADLPPKPLIAMTIREVLAWQDRIDPKYRSEAAGQYQIMEDTLRGLYAEAGLTLDSLFDAAGQDALATQLLRQRGLKKYLAGSITAEEFANNLAHEWASLPLVSGPRKGRSVYAGDGLNKSLVDPAKFLAAVRAVKDEPAPAAVDGDGLGFWARLAMALAGILRGKT
jgi:muramidase (phage lysozyme)